MWNWIAKKIVIYLPAKYKDYDNIYDWIDDIAERIAKIKEPESFNFVECESCGCLLNKSTAYRGKPLLVLKEKNLFESMGVSITDLVNALQGKPLKSNGDTNEYKLKEVYYCKKCKPKK